MKPRIYLPSHEGLGRTLADMEARQNNIERAPVSLTADQIAKATATKKQATATGPTPTHSIISRSLSRTGIWHGSGTTPGTGGYTRYKTTHDGVIWRMTLSRVGAMLSDNMVQAVSSLPPPPPVPPGEQAAVYSSGIPGSDVGGNVTYTYSWSGTVNPAASNPRDFTVAEIYVYGTHSGPSDSHFNNFSVPAWGVPGFPGDVGPPVWIYGTMDASNSHGSCSVSGQSVVQIGYSGPLWIQVALGYRNWDHFVTAFKYGPIIEIVL